MGGSTEKLPSWTVERGGRAAWKKWLERRVNSCVRRASKLATQQQCQADHLPRPADWRNAILGAMEKCEGKGRYSHMPLTLAGKKPTDWDWPSIDHVVNPSNTEVVLETRLINDMKTIMSDKEFRQIIGHVAAMARIEPRRVPKSWKCKRSFAGLEPDEKPEGTA